jgi:thiol peroxidase
MHLNDLPLDIGYASQRVSVKGEDKAYHTIGGQDGKTQLIVCAPFVDDELLLELQQIEKELPNGGEYEITASLIFDKPLKEKLSLQRFQIFSDDKEEFADFYATKLSGEPYDGALTKALILISKDGAIFYDEFLSNLSEKFNFPTLLRKVYAAQTCYTGKGCH